MTCQLVNFCFQVYNLAKGAFITIDQYLSAPQSREKILLKKEKKAADGEKKERKKEILLPVGEKKINSRF